MRSALPSLVVAALAVSCASDDDGLDSLGTCPTDNGDGDAFADCVVEFSPAEETDFNHELMPEVVLGAPGGGLDVASLGCGGSVVVYFDDPAPVDGPGPDFIVFENPFEGFAEPAQVAVSVDGEEWSVFACDPVTLEGCAGVTPTDATPASELDPSDPEVAGGDAFDLADVGLQEARYVRLRDRSEEHWAAQGEDYCDPGQQGKGGHDLDAIAVVHVP